MEQRGASRNAFQSKTRCEREKRVATQTISAESARVESVKANWKSKLIDKTQQEFRTMQKVFSGYEEENGDERLGEIESFNYVLL